LSRMLYSSFSFRQGWDAKFPNLLFLILTIWRLTTTLVVYHTANLQMLHFLFIQQIYILNILNMLHTLRFFLFKMPFIS
jgi:hypothetical protein